MKSIKLVLTVALATLTLSAMAQDFSDPAYAKWGDTPEVRKSNILASQYLKEEIGNHHFDEASKLLHQLISSCPKATENIYANGASLYKNKINRAQSVADKKANVDSLMWVYEERLKYYGDHPKRGTTYILERMAMEYQTYCPEDYEGGIIKFQRAIDAYKAAGSMNYDLPLYLFNDVCEAYKVDLLSAMDVVKSYDECAKIYEGKDVEQKKVLDGYFARSGAVNCDNIEKIFSEKLAKEPENLDVLAQGFDLIQKAKCETDFALKLSEKFYALQPSSKVALYLAQTYQNAKNIDKANKYLYEALSKETDNEERAKLLLRIGIISMSDKKLSAAVDAFRQVKQINPENGMATYFLAQCYVMGAAGEGVEKSSVFWLAYDMVQKSIPFLEADDTTTADEEDARKLVQIYRASFPSKEECFFNELREGSPYTIRTGLAAGERTVVRYR